MIAQEPRAFGYTRTSTYAQEDSLDQQKRAIELYREGKGLPQSDVFVDQASASRVKFIARPAGGKLQLALLPGDHVIITKIDRGFRNLQDMLHTIGIWESMEVNIHILALGGSDVNVSSPMGRLMVTMLGEVAEWESSMLSERMREIHAERRAQLRPLLTRPILGFIWDSEDKKTRRLMLDPQERENRIAFCDWWEDGVGYKDITEHCRKIGLKCPPNSQVREPKTGEYYSVGRVTRLIQLERELRQIHADEGREEIPEDELVLIWLERYFNTGRTGVVWRNLKRDYFNKLRKQKMRY